MNAQPSEPVVDAKKLLFSTAAAVLIAGVILLIAVLPAEYGIDPTGIGVRLGITGMSSDTEVETEPAVEQITPEAPAASDETLESVPSALTAAWKNAAPYKTDELTLTLAPNQGAEIKALMKKGERFVFTWSADGPVNFDMHGEMAGAKSDEYTSYWKGQSQQSGHGAFVAPFDGTHGWYWRNRGRQPVNVTAKTSGYYEKLFLP